MQEQGRWNHGKSEYFIKNKISVEHLFKKKQTTEHHFSYFSIITYSDPLGTVRQSFQVFH